MLIIQTTKRIGVSYLENTLAQVGDVGGRRKMIASDGPLPDDFQVPHGWECIVLGLSDDDRARGMTRRGARRTGWCCMKIALDEGALDLILLQDDLEICEGGGLVMDQVIVPQRCIAASFYSCFAVPGFQPMQVGDPRMVLMRACGTAQALKLTSAAMKWACELDPFSAPNKDPLNPHLFDDSLFELARNSPFPDVAMVIPNPVRHVGRVSACGSMNKHRQQWSVEPGEKFPADPTSLPVVISYGAGA